jgi:hypothetical protein
VPPFTPYYSKDFVIEGSWLRLDDKDKAWEEIDGRMRTAVRKAETLDVEIERTKGTADDVAAFESFCLNPDDIPRPLTDRHHLFLARMDGRCVAAILLAEVGDRLFMLCHASVDVAKKNNIPSLLLWRAVETFAGGAFKWLDVGASYRSSLQSYFGGWRTKGYPMIMKPPELKPTLMLTPFDTAALHVDIPHGAKKIVEAALEQKFEGKPHTFFPRAMYAIHALIKHLKMNGAIGDGGSVWITTTTEAHYVSSCVTSAIEQTCPWTRELTDDTAAIFVIHEFGFLHPKLKELRKLADERGIPLIEDCAYGWGTDGSGKTGDYLIYSLTKTFPLQFGGYLVGKSFTEKELWDDFGCSDPGKRDYTERRLAAWICRQEEDRAKRAANYRWYRDLFGEHRAFFPWADGTDPGAFVLRVRDEEYMKLVSRFVGTFGIECGNYWKNAAIMLPVHQRLSPMHLEYIAGSVLATEREWCGVPSSPSSHHP